MKWQSRVAVIHSTSETRPKVCWISQCPDIRMLQLICMTVHPANSDAPNQYHMFHALIRCKRFTKKDQKMHVGFMTVILTQWPPTCFRISCGHLQGGNSRNTNILTMFWGHSTVKNYIVLITILVKWYKNDEYKILQVKNCCLEVVHCAGCIIAHQFELNCIWVRALPGPMHLGLKTGPLCPMFYTKLKEPFSLSEVPDT